jgi:hypothetical protein
MNSATLASSIEGSTGKPWPDNGLKYGRLVACSWLMCGNSVVRVSLDRFSYVRFVVDLR